MYPSLRRYLFRLDPERAHGLTLWALQMAGSFPPARWILESAFATPPKPVHAFGLEFPNPVGLAAGYDKDALAVRGLAALGFGHLEIGTVTPLPQPGNPRPRMFRLVEDQAIINRLGFPSRGSEYVQMRLHPRLRGDWVQRVFGFSARSKKWHNQPPPRLSGSAVLGVNIGKNKSTSNEQAVLDYLELVQNFAPYADYLTINVSSPNTEGLRDLQAQKALEALLSQLHAQRLLEQPKLQRRLPLLVKLAPDLSEAQLAEAVDVIVSTRMDGIIVTNTTVGREGLRSGYRAETGGLSGKPLGPRSEAVLEDVIRRVNGAVPVVSAGGIMSPEDAKRRLAKGANLVQVYSGLVYCGPGLVKAIVRVL
ncbi:MAG TPA: quinone-dependent dihydroorotate dehydrogenase [Anaerolineales bacterium]|nr:quinone-dependent dihydroorotate dehydrogenase [Anaerolineales bacterium]